MCLSLRHQTRQNKAIMNKQLNPVEAAVAKQTTAMLFSCLKEFQKKGYVALTEEEDMVEGAMLQELLNRGFIKFCDSHVDAM